VEFKLKNMPIPEAHVVAIVAGVLLQLFFRVEIFARSLVGHLTGWPLIVLGAGIAGWAVVEAGEMDISSPHELVTTGPYAYSRNPMYVGWSLIYLGIAFVVNSLWLLALFPAVMLYSHFVDIRREEIELEREFGADYKEYRDRVRRYL